MEQLSLETLYKKTSTGADQFWMIRTEDNVIVTRWGQLEGKEQETRDEVKEGKNLGKKNATTAVQQAQAEAVSQWEKKLKKGYVKNLEAARAGEVDEVIEGGISPMLAHRFDEQGHKISYPALAQPKFDGHRCIAVVKDGKATLWSRTRKPITGLPHIILDLETISDQSEIPNFILDGELYNHQYKDKFEELSSFIRQIEPKAGHEVVEYHTYDLVSAETQGGRLAVILDLLGLRDYSGNPRWGSVVAVETITVDNEDDLQIAFEHFLCQGYEGLMVRNGKGLYVNKRSYDLQKVKEFADSEFTVIGVEEGRGKLAGHAIFVCETADKTAFRAKMKGKTEDLKQYFENPALAIGRQLTVKYQGITNKSGVPRFPVGLRFKEEL